MPDLNSDALGIWEHLKPAIDKEIEQKTRGMVQRRKMKVTTAPSISTGTIGVTEAFGTTEMVIPFATNLISATVGDMVWVEFMYGATNAFASMFASADEKDWDVAGDLTVHGVLDVTQRRAYSASLSAGTWYRVLVFDASSLGSSAAAYARGATGHEVVFHITRRRTNAGEETHEIKMLCQYDGVTFTDETSKSLSGYQRITKIRYTYDSTHGYVDIYASGAAAYVTVDFEVYCEPAYQKFYTSGNLVAAPAGGTGTIMKAYPFRENSDHPVLSSVTRIANSYFDATTVGRCFYQYSGNWLRFYLNLAPSTAMPPTSDFVDIATIPLPTEFTVDYILQTVPAQGGVGVLLVRVQNDGTVSVHNGTTSTIPVGSFCRAMLMTYLKPSI